MSSKKVKNLLFTLLCSLFFMPSANGQIYTSKNIKINIFSSTPIEDIKAASYSAAAVLVTEKQEISFQVAVKSLEFDKKLMQEHFNENYMESDKFPLAKFKGTIEQKIDWAKDGVHEVTANGTLLLHGVEKLRKIIGKITIKNNVISLESTFSVACEAHQVKIPKMMFTKIAEVIEVKVQGNLTQLK